ncbi:MAG: acyl-ACP--UDP-N-acetylglucosamine O-acyltransferase [Deltaproteobacteria bacterium]|nr:acyl-ACP--UDP-N-acetylglucosamine O-acyltransferase [Deltaproteobacteria bacterium]
MSTATIHPTAIIGPRTELGENVTVGPYAIIEGDVFIDSGTQIGAHVYIDHYTRIGKNCRISPFAALGTPPQDKKYKGEKTEVIIGDENVIREYVTVHRGTVDGRGKTQIGNQNMLMAYCHVAHDCQLGNGVVMANVATLAGHVTIGDFVTIYGLAAIQQFVRVGAYSMLGGKSAVVQDIPPYVIAAGDRAKLFGLNIIGLKRHDFSNEVIAALKKAYQIVIRSHLTIQEAIIRVEKEVPSFPELTNFLEFIKTSQRGVPRR